MQVRVLLFGILKDVFSRDSETLELPEGATVGALLDVYRARAPQRDELWPSVALAVNQHYASAHKTLEDGDEVALLPPVSGGSAAQPETVPNAAVNVLLIREPIDGDALLELLKRGEDGAVVVFDGIVRNHTRGRRTLFLDYEAYEAMALAEMQKLAAEAQSRFGVRGITLVHRLGTLKIGETSVWIGVASSHRAQAFDACRWIIDTLKRTVPIWKKEHFEDGAVWADGEPFPPEMTRAHPASASAPEKS